MTRSEALAVELLRARYAPLRELAGDPWFYPTEDDE